jgi:hypothetical protein
MYVGMRNIKKKLSLLQLIPGLNHIMQNTKTISYLHYNLALRLHLLLHSLSPAMEKP